MTDQQLNKPQECVIGRQTAKGNICCICFVDTVKFIMARAINQTANYFLIICKQVSSEALCHLTNTETATISNKVAINEAEMCKWTCLDGSTWR